MHINYLYILKNEYIHWYSSPEWWSALGTVFVGIVAIVIAFLQERIKRFLNKTTLEVVLRAESPDCHKIEVKDGIGVSRDSYYIRSRIINNGNFSAENVEIMIDSVYRISNENRELLKSFLPMNLVWSHYGGITMKNILPSHFRHIDIGYFILNYDNKVIFHIDTVVQPNKVEGNIYPNILSAGKYELNLIIGGDNIKSFRKKYILSFNDTFYITESDMFSKSVFIEDISDSI